MIETNEYITRYEKLQLDRDAMRDKLKIAVKALEYYADEKKWHLPLAGGQSCLTQIEIDQGCKAKAALASIKG